MRLENGEHKTFENIDENQSLHQKTPSGQSSQHKEQMQQIEEKCMSLQKKIKSYESAVEKLTLKIKEEKQEQKAKDQIIEQYLQQTRQDHELEMQDLKQYVRELEIKNEQKTASPPSPINKSFQSDPELMSLKTENSKLKQKIAETEQIVHRLQHENETNSN